MSLLEPDSEGALAEAVADAAAAGAPLEIAGGGTRAPLGRPVQAERTLSTRGLSGITLYEPGALTLVVQAGTPLAAVEAALAAEGQRLPFEPMDHRPLLGTEGEPTIGGVVACGVSGPRRLQAGACRDAMIGVRFVDGRGQAISNGGRVMKNVTGYDLVKLMAGSYGTLGVISEIGFKVLPAPEISVTLQNYALSLAEAVAAFAAALGSPYEPTGAAFLPGADGGAIIRLEGLAKSVDYRAGRLAALLARFGAWQRAEGEQSARLWQRARDVEDLAGRDEPVWRLSLRPSDAPRIAEALDDGAPLRYVADWAGGLMWIAAPPEALSALGAGDRDAGLRALHMRLRRLTGEFGGHATLIRADAPTRAALDVFHPEPAPLARISVGLRAKFDPHGILNPGRMG